MKATLVAATALVATATAFQHKSHNGFHMRRHEQPKEDVCTVYTTVYVTAPQPEPTTHYAPPPPTVATTKVPEPEQPAYTPQVPVPSSKVPPPPQYPETPKPEEPKPEQPEPYKPETPKPETPKPEEPKPEEPKPETPKPEEPKPYKPETPKPEEPKPEKTHSTSAYPPRDTEVSKPPVGGSYSSSGHIVTNGKKWAMTYTPYAPDGNCKTEADIKSDIKNIADLGFTTIRSYSTDCGVFEYVVPECQKHGLKIIYGIFLEGGGREGRGPFSDYAQEQLLAIKDNAPKDGISMLIVGNECMFNNNCDPHELASYIDYCREQLHSAGFPKDIAVTTTEPVGTWEEKGAALCDHIDVFTVQVHPYFTSTISADMAGDFAAQQLEQAARVCPGAAAKGKYITEIGWPSAGKANGIAIPGFAEQKVALKKIVDKVGSESCLFSYQNDPWKPADEYGVERNFGSYNALSS